MCALERIDFVAAMDVLVRIKFMSRCVFVLLFNNRGFPGAAREAQLILAALEEMRSSGLFFARWGGSSVRFHSIFTSESYRDERYREMRGDLFLRLAHHMLKCVFLCTVGCIDFMRFIGFFGWLGCIDCTQAHRTFKRASSSLLRRMQVGVWKM